MSYWAVIWLGVMAIALTLMAVIQIAVLLAGFRLMRELAATVQDLRRELRPLIDKVHLIVDDAGRATTLATAQMERLDQFVSATTARVNETLEIVQGLMSGPVRQGAAVVMGIRAVIEAFRHWQRRNDQPRDEEGPTFVG